MGKMFENCNLLKEVTLGENWKWIGTDSYLPTPDSTYIEGADGNWYDTSGTAYAPSTIPSNTAMTYYASKNLVPTIEKKAFAVYSADDQSLNFYKRTTVPNAGETFEGKTATAVYTGIESTNYNIQWKNNSIVSSTAIDTGIAPISMGYWFSNQENLKTLDFKKIDTSQVTDMGCMFYGCFKLTSLDVSNFDTSQVTNMAGMFARCSSLSNLNVSNFDTSLVTNMAYIFSGCQVLQKIKLGDKWNWVGTDGYLPTPNRQYIEGANRAWFDTSGTAYAPSNIPSNTAMTYYASKNLVPVIEKTAFAV